MADGLITILDETDRSALETQLSAKVPTSRMINSKTLDADVTLNASDIGATSNKNYLDNWYFANPINQRGNTIYTTHSMSIDRWIFENWNAINPTLTINDGVGITLSNNTADGTPCSTCIRQHIENPSRFAGKTVTFSAKFTNCAITGVDGSARVLIIANGTMQSFGAVNSYSDNKIISATCTLPESISSMSVVIGICADYGGNSSAEIGIEAAKFELGRTSTLQSDSAPDFVFELTKCQRYYQKITNVYAYGHTAENVAYVALPLTVTMRKLPEYICHQCGGLYVNNTIHYPSNVYPSSIADNCVILGVTVNGVSANTMAVLCDASIELFADF